MRLELKASRSGAYLSQGLFQLLGYVKDRPRTLRHSPAAWLVTPVSGAFETANPGDSELWAVSADAVASNVVTRFADLIIPDLSPGADTHCPADQTQMTIPSEWLHRRSVRSDRLSTAARRRRNGWLRAFRPGGRNGRAWRRCGGGRGAGDEVVGDAHCGGLP